MPSVFLGALLDFSMPFLLLGAILTTYRLFSHSTPSCPLSILPAAQKLLVGNVELELERSRPSRNILPGAAAGDVEIVKSEPGHAKNTRIQVFEAGAGTSGSGPFSPESELKTKPSGH